MLGWTPGTFWGATFYELSCAYVGYCRANGQGRWKVRDGGLSDVEADELMAFTAEMKAKYPDGPTDKAMRRKLKERA